MGSLETPERRRNRAQFHRNQPFTRRLTGRRNQEGAISTGDIKGRALKRLDREHRPPLKDLRPWLAGMSSVSVCSLAKVKVWIALALFLLVLPAQAADAELTALSFDAKALKEKFNSTAHQSRLIMILSPT